MGNKSLYQILEVLGTGKGKNCNSLVSSSKFRSFWLKHISHIFPPQSSYIIKTAIRAYELTDWGSPKYNRCLLNTTEKGRHLFEMSSNILTARTFQSENVCLHFVALENYFFHGCSHYLFNHVRLQ